MYYNENAPQAGQGQGGGQHGAGQQYPMGGSTHRGGQGGYPSGGHTSNFFPFGHSYPMMWFNKYGYSKPMELYVVEDVHNLMHEAKKKLKENPNSKEFINDLYTAYNKLETFLTELDKQGHLQR